MQCAENIAEHCPKALAVPVSDTSVAAADLSRGEYPPNSAVLCSHRAGEHVALELLADKFEDKDDNVTTFVLIRLVHPTQPVQENLKPERLILSAAVVPHLARVLFVISIFAAFYLQDRFEMSLFQSALIASAAAGSVSMLLFSDRRTKWLAGKYLGGYWRYTTLPGDLEEAPSQAHDIPRLVHVDLDDDGDLRFRGWRVGDGLPHRWESQTVFTTQPGKKTGKLVYIYGDTKDHADHVSLDGIVQLTWNLAHAARPLSRMSGKYYGYQTNETGRLAYERISKEQFEQERTTL